MSDAAPSAPARRLGPDDPDYPRALFDLGARAPSDLFLRGVTP